MKNMSSVEKKEKNKKTVLIYKYQFVSNLHKRIMGLQESTYIIKLA